MKLNFTSRNYFIVDPFPLGDKKNQNMAKEALLVSPLPEP